MEEEVHFKKKEKHDRPKVVEIKANKNREP